MIERLFFMSNVSSSQSGVCDKEDEPPADGVGDVTNEGAREQSSSGEHNSIAS